MRKILFALAMLGIAIVPVVAAASMQSTAVAALVSYERTQQHNTDVESPQCYVIQTWAQCSFGTGHGNAEVNGWLHYKNGAWKVLGTGGGVTFASQLESQYGIPAAIAKAFQAKQ